MFFLNMSVILVFGVLWLENNLKIDENRENLFKNCPECLFRTEDIMVQGRKNPKLYIALTELSVFRYPIIDIFVFIFRFILHHRHLCISFSIYFNYSVTTIAATKVLKQKLLYFLSLYNQGPCICCWMLVSEHLYSSFLSICNKYLVFKQVKQVQV